jgi:AraC-like DNA-binding protein
MPDAAITLRFDSETHLDPAERVAAWREAMALSVDVAFEPEEATTFAGRLAFYALGTVLLVDAETTPHTMIRDRRTIARTGEDHVILDVFPYGGFTGTVGGKPLTVGPGDGFVMDLRGTLRVRLAATRFLGLIVPRALFEGRVGAAKALHGLCLEAGQPEARLLGSLLESLLAEAPHLSASRAAALGLAAVCLVGACLGTGEPPPKKEKQKRPAVPEPTLARVRRHIERHACDPELDPDRLASAFGLSRTVLYRMFQPEGGVAQIIRRRRTAIARRLLIDPDNPHGSIDDIARASGFADTRTLRRALRELYDTSPRQLRPAEPVPAEEEHRVEIGALFDAEE